MFTRKTAFATAFAISLLTTDAASAQIPAFGVQALASTSGYSGTYPDNAGTLSGGQSISAASDPAGLQYNNGYGLVYGDAAASATSYTHLLYANVYAYADRISATAFGNASPTANTEGRYYDYITVHSSTLPVGTQVEVIFRNALNTEWDATKNYSGSIYSELQVGGYSASTTSRMDSTWGTNVVAGPEFRAKLKVGSRYSLNAKLRLYGRAFYFAPGPIWDGMITIETAAEVQMDPNGHDVWISYDSDSVN
ncbi:MAG TPA: hypothetical protein VN493_21925 [Thermoanaerobaculia bacterium]|nr:hypothetical protein [Thermoanaerobaculia bacterium]